MKRILVGQSGGPTAVINSSLYGVIMEAKEQGCEVYGMINGIEGFLEEKYIDLTGQDVDYELLKCTPASYLGSCRYKLPENLNEIVYRLLFEKFKKLAIDIVLYIGGNDSMDTVDKLSRYADEIESDIKFIGIPKTIDNDLVETDHCPGYGSAAKFVAGTVRDVVWDAGVYDRPVVTIVEIMGRHAGWLTAASVLARTEYEKNPLLIYLPEIDFDLSSFLRDVKDALEQSRSVVVCVSEGIKDAAGKLICEYEDESVMDQFGHKMLAGAGKVLEHFIKSSIGCKCRSIELNLPQRCFAQMTSAKDIEEAEIVGRTGVAKALKGQSGSMVAMIRAREEGYNISYEMVPVTDVCNLEKKFPSDWIVNGNDISDKFYDYVEPLIQGEHTVEFEGGLPRLLKPAYK